MLSTAIGIQFDVNDLDANYEVIGSSDNYSFQYNLGKGSSLVDFEGDTAQKTISLKGNYGDFDVRIFAVSDIGIRSAFIEEKISISPPSFEDTFTFSDIRVANLPGEPNIGSTIEIEPSISGNILAVNSEYVNKNLEIQWRLAPPIGHAKEGLSLGNELLSDKLLKNFSLQIRNTENGDIISSSQLNSSLGLQQTLNTPSVADSMGSYTGFSFIISEDTVNELNLDRTLALEVVCHDAFDRQSTGVLTGINYLPTIDTLSYGLFGAKMSFSWSHSDTDFQDVEIISLGIPGEENIYDPLSVQNSIDYYNSLNSAPDWEKHSSYRIGDRVENNGEVFECVQGYSYSSNPNVTTDHQSYWSGLGEPFLFYSDSKKVNAVSSTEYNQIWGYNYYYSFLPSDGYGTGQRLNLTETGLSAGGVLAPFKSDVKIDNLNFIEREDDLIFRWNITDQDNNLVDLNQYKFLIGNSDKPTLLGISGSLFDSDTNKFLTGITDGLNSRTSTTENGQEIIIEDLPGTKVFETFEYTREINNSIYKNGGFPAYSSFSSSGNYGTGDYVAVNNENLYQLILEQSVPFVQPEYTNWRPEEDYVFRTGANYSDCFLYNDSIYCPTGSNHGDIVGPSANDVLGIFNESENYSIGDLVIAPSEIIDIYKTGSIFNVGDNVLHQGSLYKALVDQSNQDSIYPNTGINHWSVASAFSDIGCFIYKAISNVSAGSEIIPGTGFSHWQKQTPDISDKYQLCATGYDFAISSWSDDQNFNSLSLVVYENDIWSGVADSGPNSAAGIKEPSMSNSNYWVNTLGGSHDFSTNHQIGDKVYSNGFVYQCTSNNPTGAPVFATKTAKAKANSSYDKSQWIPYWELNEDFVDVIFGHQGIPQSGKRSVGLELAILDPAGDILNTRSIIGNNPEPSIIPQGFQVDSLSNVTNVHFNFNYAFGSREQTTKVHLYRSDNPNFSILDSNGLPGSGSPYFVSEILGPGDSTFGENITSITDTPPIPHIDGLGDQITGYYYKILPFDAFGSGDIFNVTDNQGDLERVLVYPHGYNNQNKNGYMGPVFSTTEDAIPGPVINFEGGTSFKNYFLNWKLPDSQFDLSNNLVLTSPNDISHYEVWQSEDNHLYFGTRNEALGEEENLSGYRKITGDLTSVGPIPSEINDPALGITNATNVFDVSAISPSIQVNYQGEPNDKRYFWVRAVDHAGNKGPFTGEADLSLYPGDDVVGLELILGQAKTTDIADFEQNITEAFPNNIALVPNNPFKNNHPSAGEISWDRHFLYHEGEGYVIGPGTANNLDQYVYWSSTGKIPTHDQNIVSLTSAQSGELGLGQLGGGSSLLSSDITNPLRNIKYSGGYDTSSYHPAGEGVKGLNQDSERPSLLGEVGDYIIARNSLGVATPMWHAFSNALIGSAHIQEAAITNAKIHNMTADKIRSAEIFGQDIEVGGTGQIRSAGFEGLHSVDQFGKQQQGFAISGDGTFVFQTEVGKLFFEDDELTIHGNIRQKDGSELTVLNLNAEPSTFSYSENRDGKFIPDDTTKEIVLTAHFNNSEITSNDVRFRMTDPDGNEIFGYNDYASYSNGNVWRGFSYDSFDLNSRIAKATLRCGDRFAGQNPSNNTYPLKEGFDTIIHPGVGQPFPYVPSDDPDFLSINIFSSGIGSSTEDSVTINMLSQGGPGPTGRSPVYRGSWNSYNTYLGIEDGANTAEELRGDVVYNTTDTSYYIAIQDNTNKRPDLNPSDWQQFGAQFESVATKLLLAENAVITHSLTMGSSDSNNPATNGAGGAIISSSFVGAFNNALTANLPSENYSNAGFRLQKSAVYPHHVALDVGGPNSYFRYSSISDKVEIKGSFINNSISQNVQFDPTVSPSDSQSIFIGGGYNNTIGATAHSSNLNSLASSIVGGAENTINSMFSFIGNGYQNTVKDDYSAIVAGYQNQMPNSSENRQGANIIGAGAVNKIDGGSSQGILCGDKNEIAYNENDTTYLINSGLINVEASVFNKNLLGDGSNNAGFSPTLRTWVTENTWFPASPIGGTTLGYWGKGMYTRDFFNGKGNKPGFEGWVYDINFEWVYMAVSGNPYLESASPQHSISIFTEVFGSGEWIALWESQILTNSTYFTANNVATNVGTWQSGSGIMVYRWNYSSTVSENWWVMLRNSSGTIFYTQATPFNGNYQATPAVGDIDGDGVSDASDNTPAIRLRGIRQSNGTISWYIYVIFTNTSLTHAKLYVSSSPQFSGSLYDTKALSSQNSYKATSFQSSSVSNTINGYINASLTQAYFRFPVSSNNGSSYTDSQTIESIGVGIPTVGSSPGDENSSYKYLYQSL